MTTITQLIVFASALFTCTSHAQVSFVPPKHFTHAVAMNSLNLNRLELSHNSQASICGELLDTNTVSLIAESTGLSKEDLASIQLAPGLVKSEIWLYRLDQSEKASKIFEEKLRFYVEGREEGHTRAFLLNALTNRNKAPGVSDPNLRALFRQRAELAGSQLQQRESGFYTNELDVVFRRLSYYLQDGEVAWCYDFFLSSGGYAFDIFELKVDAKEFDPKLGAIIKGVDREVREEMKQNGTFGQFGSTRYSWQLKKEKLKARGIEWHSPRELNPGLTID